MARVCIEIIKDYTRERYERKETQEKRIVKQKYIGETAWSLYARGFEHQQANSAQNGLPRIKGCPGQARGGEQLSLAFEQQERRNREILNCCEEYNRSLVPRLIIKLWDKEYKNYEEGMQEEKGKEEYKEERV